ncbi:hypothetical protein PFISCL1PPCAC_15312, partial [Pristionchus fissidentatus]
MIKNGWHSLIYVALDLEKSQHTVSKSILASLRIGHHNFTLYLFKQLGNKFKAGTETDNFLIGLIEGLKGDLEGSAAVVLEKILDFGVRTINTDGDGHSRIMEYTFMRGKYGVAERLRKYDRLFMHARPRKMARSVIQTLVKRWFECEEEEKTKIKEWLIRFRDSNVFTLNEPIAVSRRALPGLTQEDAEARTCAHIPPLSAAIQYQDAPLIQFLVVEGGVNVNVIGEGRPALFEALITNNEAVIKALIDGELIRKTEKNEEKEDNGKEGKTRRSLVVNLGVNGNEEEEKNDEEMKSEGEEEEEDEEDNEKIEKKTEISLELEGKTGVDVKITDDRARNLCHFLVSPCGWQNTKILEAFVKRYPVEIASLLSRSDRNGDTPIGLAAKENQWIMHAAMMKYAFRPTMNEPIGLKITAQRPSKYRIDVESDLMKKELEEKMKKEEKKIEDVVTPNSKSGYEKTGELVKCKKTGQLYKVLLNKTDLRKGLYGLHNYYKMELIKRKDIDLFILFTNWGRIGDSQGEFQV